MDLGGEEYNCRNLNSMLSMALQQERYTHGIWRLGVDEEEKAKKERLLNAVLQALENAYIVQRPTLMIEVIWEASGGLAERIREERIGGLPEAVRRLIEKPLVTGEELEELARRDGEDFLLVPAE